MLNLHTFLDTTKYTVWKSTTYSAPRSVKVKVRQTKGQISPATRTEAVLTITQNNGAQREGYNTFYEFGRKDALPGTNTLASGSSYSFDNTPGGHSIGYAIQHPEKMFGYAGTGTYYADWCNATYYNLWSMGNTVTGFNDNAVVKTIYDPCPAGFHMPASNAFTGFTTTGNNSNKLSELNINGAWDYGFNFNNKLSSPDATIFFPASGCRRDGSLDLVGATGNYSLAVPISTDGGCAITINGGYIYPKFSCARAYALAVRPVAEPKTAVRPGVSGSTITPWGSDGASEGGTIFAGDESTVAP